MPAEDQQAPSTLPAPRPARKPITGPGSAPPPVPEIARSIRIPATPETVFRFLSESAHFARWFGPNSTITPTVGGAVAINFPGGARSGEVLEFVPNRKLSFTWREASPNAASPTNSPAQSPVTTVEFTLTRIDTGTLVHLRHHGFAPGQSTGEQEECHGGWRYLLAILSGHAATDQLAAKASASIADYMALWNEPDATKRAELAARATAATILFSDAFGVCVGQPDFLSHVADTRNHMQNLTIRAVGPAAQSHGCFLQRWETTDPTGKPVASGTDFFELAPDGRITRVTGFWDPPKS
jgi:uncharacterized protein YndB with AHSA1/START domain